MIKAEKPAQGISETGNWTDGSKSFHIDCDCHSADHSVNMWIEVQGDNLIKEAEVTFYVDTYTSQAYTGWKRIQLAWTILTKGIIRQEHSLLLKKQAAINVADAIIKTVTDLEK